MSMVPQAKSLPQPRVQQNNVPLGILLMIGATIVFALQDGISRHLAGTYNTYMVVMVRYWFFAAFVVFLAARAKGGIKEAARTDQLWLQIFRGVLLVGEICVAVYGFTVLGLIESQAVFICYPLLVAALFLLRRRTALLGAGLYTVVIANIWVLVTATRFGAASAIPPSTTATTIGTNQRPNPRTQSRITAP